MSALTKQLRQCAREDVGGKPEDNVMWEAADEIDALEGERDRLREALEELLRHASFVGIAPHHERMARAALTPPGTGGGHE